MEFIYFWIENNENLFINHMVEHYVNKDSLSFCIRTSNLSHYKLRPALTKWQQVTMELKEIWLHEHFKNQQKTKEFQREITGFGPIKRQQP